MASRGRRRGLKPEQFELQGRRLEVHWDGAVYVREGGKPLRKVTNSALVQQARVAFDRRIQKRVAERKRWEQAAAAQAEKAGEAEHA